MGLFDNLGTTAPSSGTGERDIVFPSLPNTMAEFQALPQAALATPYDTAAMTVLALCFYPQDREASLQMLDYLRGPRPLTAYDKSFIKDRFMGQDYIPRSYFVGAVPQNDYAPSQPYTVRVSDNPYSFEEQGFAKLFVASGGADSPRPVQLRLAKDGKWYLWEQSLLTGIRAPESTNPWA